jgi:hypothetical protein
VLVPNTVSPVLEHVSHATQHEPFTARPTEYGYNELAVIARWNVQHAFIELTEGYN